VGVVGGASCSRGTAGAANLDAVLIGFRLWHVVDSVLSHSALGIHRIKLDSPDPLIWDLVWFFAFGVAPVLVGTLLMRRKSGGRLCGRRL